MNKTEILVKKLTIKGKTISTMESCTGGALASEITNVSGASNVIKYSSVTYSDEYKIKMGVDKDTLDKYGVYSQEVARSMARAIADYANSDYGIGITGRIEAMAYVCIYNRQKESSIYHELRLDACGRQENKEKIISFVIDKLLEIV